MQWSEVRQLFPDQFVQIKALNSHYEGNKLYIDEVAVIRAIQDEKEATKVLVSSKDETFVYHTANEQIIMEVRTRSGLRRHQ
jgi:hypothetical protein